jgi:hypothetical protein
VNEAALQDKDSAFQVKNEFTIASKCVTRLILFTLQKLKVEFEALKHSVELEAQKREEEEAQKSKGLFSRKKKEATPTK